MDMVDGNGTRTATRNGAPQDDRRLGLSRDDLARRAARELRAGERVTLGAGLPALVARHAASDVDLRAHDEEALDLALLDALEVSKEGDLAVDRRAGPLPRAARIVVVMDHATSDGAPKILEACGLPLSGRQVVHRILTDLACIDVTPDGLVLREVAPGVSARAVQEKTEPTLKVAPDLAPMIGSERMAAEG